MSGVSDHDAPCMSCDSIVNSNSNALECDLCEGWAHTECIGVSPEAYNIHCSMEGLPWFCTSCKEVIKSLKSSVEKLTAENHALRIQVSELSELSRDVKELQGMVGRLNREVDFISKDTLNGSCTPTSTSPSPIPIHSNPFMDLSVEVTDPPPQDTRSPLTDGNASLGSPNTLSQHVIDSRKKRRNRGFAMAKVGRPDRNNPPKKSATHSEPVTSPKTHTVYLRAIPKEIKPSEIAKKLDGFGIKYQDLQQPEPNSKFVGKSKFVKLTITNDACNKLDRCLKRASIGWFVSIFPPRRPRMSLGRGNQSFLGCSQHSHTPPLSQPIIPPLHSRLNHFTPAPQIPALMSLKLPPLPPREKTFQ